MSFYYIQNDIKDAAFHFAVEEYFLRRTTHNVVMIWQTGDCVMLGKNQLLDAEIDLDFAEKKDVQITRRSSGGGTIFTDCGTFLFTLICPTAAIFAAKPAKTDLSAKNPANIVFNMSNSVRSFSDGASAFGTANSALLPNFDQEDNPLLRAKKLASLPVVDVLQRLGADARLLGRNDILIGDKKVSGIAQYAADGRICTHGSLLFDANLDMLGVILTPDSEKLAKKAVRSVKSRVTNIKNHVNCDINDFACVLRQGFLDFFNEGEVSLGKLTPYTLTEAELAEIEVIRREKYANKSWVFGEPIPSHMPLVNLAETQNYAAGNELTPPNCEYMFSAGVITSTNDNAGNACPCDAPAMPAATDSEKNNAENFVGRSAQSTSDTSAQSTSDTSAQNTSDRSQSPIIKESFHTKARFAAGGIDLFIDSKGGVITRILIRGDFLATEDIAELEKHLQGIPLEKNAMDSRLSRINLDPFLGGITKEEFLSMIF